MQAYIRNRTPVPQPHRHTCYDCKQAWDCQKDPCYTSPRVPAEWVICGPCIQRTAEVFAKTGDA